MRCGSKCFLIEMEVNGEIQKQSVTARTPAEARKTMRIQYGAELHIVSVKEARKM